MNYLVPLHGLQERCVFIWQWVAMQRVCIERIAIVSLPPLMMVFLQRNMPQPHGPSASHGTHKYEGLSLPDQECACSNVMGSRFLS